MDLSPRYSSSKLLTPQQLFPLGEEKYPFSIPYLKVGIGRVLYSEIFAFNNDILGDGAEV